MWLTWHYFMLINHTHKLNALLRSFKPFLLLSPRLFSDSIHSNIDKRIKKNKLVISEVMQEKWEFADVKHLTCKQYLKTVEGVNDGSFKASPFVVLDVRALDEDIYEPLDKKNSVFLAYIP
eukprot:TRINITY_DN16976_c0_g1_i13.p3 TRINITY_DN16976_c0_g1~~TRINITY_DN16976_c0_g1_i13.p3  ORF type:complete len:121 (-),score=27.39 TRINITY_DN16976_c0_g1_i13:344-706(-)